jgi:hypothetical protein
VEKQKSKIVKLGAGCVVAVWIGISCAEKYDCEFEMCEVACITAPPLGGCAQ